MDILQRAGNSWSDAKLGSCCLRDGLPTLLKAASFIDKLVAE